MKNKIVETIRLPENDKIVEVIRIPENELIGVGDAFFMTPCEFIKKDRNGRKHYIKTRLVSHNGKHTICRDVGAAKWDMYWEKLPVDKIVLSDLECKMYLRKIKRNNPIVKELSEALKALGYKKGDKFSANLAGGLIQIKKGAEEIGIYDLSKHTFVE